MTENQIYPISGEFFDNSSNSSNILKFDLYSVGLCNSNSNSNSGLCGQTTPLTAISPQLTYNHHSNASNDSSRGENPMLTTASISIPQRSGSNNMSSYHVPRIMADFSEFGLDALDASSLSPTLLQDVSLNTTAVMSSSATPVSNVNANYTNSSNQINTAGNIILYEVPSSNGGTTVWSDIQNAIITTKPEPFNMEDDYIFQIDRNDLSHQGPTLAELNDERLLEDLNIEDLVPAHHENYLITQHGNLHQLQSPVQVTHLSQSPQSSSSSSNGPPQQLLHHMPQQQPHTPPQHTRTHQHHHQQNHQQQHQHSSPYARNNYDDHQRHTNPQQHQTQQQGSSSSPYEIYHSTPNKAMSSNVAFSPGSQTSSNSPLLINSVTPPPHANRSHYHQHNLPHHSAGKPVRNLQDLIKKEYSMSPDRSVLGQSVPGPSTSHLIMSGNALSPASSGFGSAGRKSSYGYVSGGSRLSSSAPTHLGMEQIWQRREPRQHLLSTGSLAEAESYSSISTGSVLSPEGNEFSQDEGYSDYDSDHYEDCSSDGSDNEDDSRNTPNAGSSKGKERFFWQYNVQSKGPKGQRLVIKSQLEDPHVLNEVTDPVFSPNCSVRGIKVFKHSGKARKGDGNDLTPNPRKLHNIGNELDKLGRKINDMTPVSELPFNVRPKSRKEKNKLASRACRLKKKAQHEANKIKLFGLELEHKKLINGINDLKRALAVKYSDQCENTEEINQQIESIAQQAAGGIQIAGGTTDFVNKVLENVKKGVPSGGLEELRHL